MVKNITSKFTAGTASMNVNLRTGKNGVSVFAATKDNADAKPVRAALKVFTGENARAEAGAAHDALLADASAKGWTLVVKTGRTPKAILAEIPMAPGFAAAPATEEAPAENGGKRRK